MKDFQRCLVEPRASSQPMLDFPRLALAKGTRLICEGFEEIGESFQQTSVTGSKACKEEHIRTIANDFPIFRPVKTAIHPRCPGISLLAKCVDLTTMRHWGPGSRLGAQAKIR